MSALHLVQPVIKTCPKCGGEGPFGKKCGKCFRGLIHGHCNSLLGYAKDNVSILEAAVRYLKKGG